jgi:hypothetical protein
MCVCMVSLNWRSSLSNAEVKNAWSYMFTFMTLTHTTLFVLHSCVCVCVYVFQLLSALHTVFIKCCDILRPVFQQLNEFLFVTKISVYDLPSNFLLHIILLYVLISKYCFLIGWIECLLKGIILKFKLWFSSFLCCVLV